MSKFTNIGEMVKAVHDEATKGVKDDRLIQCKQQQEQVGADGGYVVGEEIIGPILNSIFYESKLLSKATKLTTNKYSGKIPYLEQTEDTEATADGFQTFWVGEDCAKTVSKFKLGQLNLKLHKLVALMPVSDELLEDSPLLNSFIPMFIKESRMGSKIDSAILTGNGTTSMYGIMSAVTHGTIGVAEPNPIDQACLLAFRAALSPYAQNKSEWFMSQENYNDVLSITFSNDGALSYKDGDTYLFGLKVNIIPSMVTPNDLMLGDVSNYAVLSKGTIAESISVSIRYDYDEQQIRWVFRLAGMSFGNKMTLEDGTETGTFVVPLGSPSEQSSSSSSTSYVKNFSTSSSNSSSSSYIIKLSSDSSKTSSSSTDASISSSSSKSISSSSMNNSASTESSSESTGSSGSTASSSQSSGGLGTCEEYYIASTFVTNVLNGRYDYVGLHNSRPKYQNAGGYYLFWASGSSVWAISLISGSAPANWVSNSTGATTCPPGAYTDEAGLIS